MANNRYLTLVRETGAYGSGTGTQTGILITSIDDPVDRGAIKEETLDNINVNTVYGGALKLGGSLEGSLRPKQMKDLFYSVLGVETDSGDDLVYTLGYPRAVVMTVGEDIGGTNMAMKYVGGAIKDLTISAEAKDFATVKATWLAKNVSKVTYTEPTYTSEEPVLFYHVAVTVGSTSITQCKKFDLKIGKNVREDNFVLGDFTLSGLAINGVSDISGTITFTELEYNQLLAAAFSTTSGSSVPALNTLFHGGLTIVFKYPDGSDAMTIDTDNCNFTKASRSIQARSEISKSVDFVISGDDFSITVHDAGA